MHAGWRKVLRVRNSATGQVSSMAADVVVNAAGLQAQEVASALAGLPAESVPKRHLARGCYFALTGAHTPETHLIRVNTPAWHPEGPSGPRLLLRPDR